MNENFDYGVVDGILKELGCSETNIIAILQSVQEHYRYLPREVFPYLALKLGVPEAQIYSVATFYENFSLEPKGKFVIKVCDGTACHVRKSIPILERLRASLICPIRSIPPTIYRLRWRRYHALAHADLLR